MPSLFFTFQTEVIQFASVDVVAILQMPEALTGWTAVPCFRRAASVEEEYEAAGGEVLLDNDEDDGWLATHGAPRGNDNVRRRSELAVSIRCSFVCAFECFLQIGSLGKFICI